MSIDPSENDRHVQFTRHFAECERAMTAFAYSLVPNHSDADDIIQETLAALWKHFDDYDPSRPFLPWANRFVYRQVLMHRRAKATREKYVFSDETFEKLAKPETVSLDHDLAIKAALEKCLAKLSPKNRNLIEQRYLSKGSMQNYAGETGRTPNSIYKMLQRIRESLHHCIRKRLEKEGITP